MINESRGMGELSDGEVVDLGWKWRLGTLHLIQTSEFLPESDEGFAVAGMDKCMSRCGVSTRSTW